MLAMAGTGGAGHSDHNLNVIAHLAAWQQTLIVIAAVASIVLAGRYLTRPVFRFIAESRMPEIFTATALLLVVGIALLMNKVGLSPALGAFIAGVVLANSEYRHELEADIDPFKALLLGLFFISVGAGIDFPLLIEKPVLIGSVVVGLIAVKFAILWFLAWVYGVKGGDRYWFAFALAQGGEFGFVLLSFSLQNRVVPENVADVLTVSIALSMFLAPMLIMANERLVQPRFSSSDEPQDEEKMEQQESPVIIAGFGRFGQIVGRLLIANGFEVTVLDNSAAHIDRVRRFGFQVYYGDAGRMDLLHTAGAERAKLLIVAVDDRDKVTTIVETVKKHFPGLAVYTRAYDVLHYHELLELGADYIERELFEASMKVGEKALQALGMRAYQAHRKALQFASHDQFTIDELAQHRSDNKRYISESKKAQEEVLEILRADRASQGVVSSDAWDATGHD